MLFYASSWLFLLITIHRSIQTRTNMPQHFESENRIEMKLDRVLNEFRAMNTRLTNIERTLGNNNNLRVSMDSTNDELRAPWPTNCDVSAVLADLHVLSQDVAAVQGSVDTANAGVTDILASISGKLHDKLDMITKGVASIIDMINGLALQISQSVLPMLESIQDSISEINKQFKVVLIEVVSKLDAVHNGFKQIIDSVNFVSDELRDWIVPKLRDLISNVGVIDEQLETIAGGVIKLMELEMLILHVKDDLVELIMAQQPQEPDDDPLSALTDSVNQLPSAILGGLGALVEPQLDAIANSINETTSYVVHLKRTLLSETDEIDKQLYRFIHSITRVANVCNKYHQVPFADPNKRKGPW